MIDRSKRIAPKVTRVLRGIGAATLAAHPNVEVSESLSFVLDGNPFQPLEISGMHGNRIHKPDAPVGKLKVDYAATIVGQTDPAPVTVDACHWTGSTWLRTERS